MPGDEGETREQLLGELEAARQTIAELRTERRQADGTLHETEADFRSLFETSRNRWLAPLKHVSDCVVKSKCVRAIAPDRCGSRRPVVQPTPFSA